MVDFRTKQPLESVPVAVGPDGKPPPPPPPPGSYAAMAQEQQAAAAHAQQQPQTQAAPPPANQQQILGAQPLVGPTQAIDGSVAPPLTLPPQQPDTQGELSPNVQQRFSDMSAQLRTMEQQLQQGQAELQARDANIAELTGHLETSQKAQQEILQANLDELDPDTRARVLADSQMQERFAEMEKRLTARFQPNIETLEVEASKQRMMDLANRYPAFDIQIHGPLIEMYRGKNPHSSVAQAFRAIAQDGELVPREAAPLTVAPPIVSPNGVGGPNQAQPRYMPEPTVDPEASMRADSLRAGQLMRSNSHVDRVEGMRLIDKNIAERLGSSLPGG